MAIQIGTAYVGPKCAKKAGIKANEKLGIKRVALNRAKPVHKDTKTIDMFDGAQGVPCV